ncbi:MAG: hypothetical protein R3B96_13840 [Pirellulaceae bacterium]
MAGSQGPLDRPSQLDEAEVPGWEIQRGDGAWETVAARLHDGGIVIAVTPEQRTAAVRYAWAPQPPLECLYDDSELPLPPGAPRTWRRDSSRPRQLFATGRIARVPVAKGRTA